MTFTQVMFYLLSAGLLTFGFLSVTTRKIFRAAIFLLFSLIGVAGLFFMLDYDFLAAVQIVVYVGGIVVLIIFSVFLTHSSGEDMALPPKMRELIVFSLSFFGFALTCMMLFKHGFLIDVVQPGQLSVRTIGTALFDAENTGMSLPFEALSILLLAAMIGAIVIALRIPATSKTDKTADSQPEQS